MSQDSDLNLARGLLERLVADLSLLVDREIELATVRAERAYRRPAGRKRVHVSFRLEFTSTRGGPSAHGCVLIPLPDALSLVGLLGMRTDQEVLAMRYRTSLDETSKDTLLEIGNYIGAAMGEALEDHGPRVRARGCQGVRADVRPALPYTEGSELLVARGRARLLDAEPFELIAVLPSGPFS